MRVHRFKYRYQFDKMKEEEKKIIKHKCEYASIVVAEF